MGRPRGGKGRKSIEAAKNEDGSSGGEEVIPAYKRRGRPQKHHLKDDHVGDEEDDDIIAAKTEDEDDDIAKIEAGAAKTIAPSNKAVGSAQNAGRKRRRQLKRRSGSSAMDQEKDGPSSRQNGFRQHGSRRKNSTPRRAAEAGLECK